VTAFYVARSDLWTPVLGGDTVPPGTPPAPETITHGSQVTSGNTGFRGGLFNSSLSGNLYVNAFFINSQNNGSLLFQNQKFTACGFAFGSGTSGLDTDEDGNVVVTFQNCYFEGPGETNGGVWFNTTISGDDVPANFKLVIDHCTFDGLGQVDDAIEQVVIAGGQFEMTRCEIKNLCGVTRNFSDNWSITECYAHSLATLSPEASPHSSVVGILQGHNISVVRSKLFTFDPATGEEGPNIGATAAFDCLARQQGNSDTITLQDCAIGGGGYAVYCGGDGSFTITHFTASGNIIYRDAWAKGGQFGPCNSFGNSGSESSNVWSNNTWGPLGPHNLGGDPAEGTQIPAA
jgi:hypothetical protein